MWKCDTNMMAMYIEYLVYSRQGKKLNSLNSWFWGFNGKPRKNLKVNNIFLTRNNGENFTSSFSNIVIANGTFNSKYICIYVYLTFFVFVYTLTKYALTHCGYVCSQLIFTTLSHALNKTWFRFIENIEILYFNGLSQ